MRIATVPSLAFFASATASVSTVLDSGLAAKGSVAAQGKDYQHNGDNYMK
jgi:hypothetical protein